MNNTAQDTGQALRSAQALAAAGKQAEAEALLKEIIRRDPSCGMALYRLGIIAAQREDFSDAAGYFSRALVLAPDAPEILLSLAAAKLEQGEGDAAYSLAEKASTLTNSAMTLHRLGGVYRQAGRMDQAQEAYERALQIDPSHIPAYYGLGIIGKLKAGSPHFTQLQKLGENGSRLSPDDRSVIAFTLGRSYLDAGDVEKAFQQFTEGNRLKKSTVARFDAAKFDDYIDSIIRLFDAKTAAALAGQGSDSGRPVFVIGMPRSGSTLADQIISSHPSAASIGESRFFQRSLPAFPHPGIPGLFAKGSPHYSQPFLDALSPETLQGISGRYLALTDGPAKGASRLADKMLFNYLWTGIIRAALPDAKIIHCTRDPRDIALSLWQLTFPSGMQWTYDLQDIAHYYLAYKKLMAHWNALFPSAIHEVGYEKMVAGQENETRQLLDFCGLPWDDSCLNFHESARLVKTSSSTQVRQPVHGGSVGKWKQYEKHLAPFLQVFDKSL